MQAVYLDGNATSVRENEDFMIGGLVSVDEDLQDSHFYTLLTGWDLFDVKEVNQLWAMGTKGIDYETQQEVMVEVHSTSTGNPPLYVSREFIFTVEDVNEAPTDILLSNNEVYTIIDIFMSIFIHIYFYLYVTHLE